MLKRAWFNIRYALLLSGCWLFGKLPSWLLYHVFLDVIYFFVYKVAGYRIGVVRDNLRRAFPEKDAEELRIIEKRFYLQLAEIFIDTIDLISISRKDMAKRLEFIGTEQHEAEVAGGSWVAALAHYGSWEYFTSYQMLTDAQVVGVYHKLHSGLFEKLYKYSRARCGAKPVAMRDTMRYVVESARAGRAIVLGLIADQAPRMGEKPNWFDFFSQKTDFYIGPEKIALKFHMPVYFIYTRKKARARYMAEFVRIYDGVEDVPEGEITRRYAVRLEAMIRESPWLWMWSHKRWKKQYKPSDEQ